MKINNQNPVAGVDRGATPAAEPGGPPAKTDKVSLEQSQQEVQLVESARRQSGSSRAVRLREIEDQIRRGGYRPDASRVADEILAAAEIEVRLRAMMG